MKKCTKCNELTDQFYADKRNKDGLRSHCKSCENSSNSIRDASWHFKNNLRRNYNLELEEYKLMLARQDNKCKLCGKTEEENGKRLAVDHCHTSGEVRDLLCSNCNSALGFANDDPELLRRMAEYCEEYNGKYKDSKSQISKTIQRSS